MKKSAEPFDIFLAASPLDAGVAEVVRQSFEARGLNVFAERAIADDRDLEEMIRSAIIESRGFVTIVSRASINDAKIAVELGGAWGWGKPITLLLHGFSPSDLPDWLARYPHPPITELSAVIDDVIRATEPPTPEQCEALADAFTAIGVPIDQLLDRLGTLDELTERFNRQTLNSYPPERVFQELFRLRKRGRLPKLKRKTG